MHLQRTLRALLPLALMLLLSAVAGSARQNLPRIPPPKFCPRALAGAPLNSISIRLQLETTLPGGSKVVMNEGTTASELGANPVRRPVVASKHQQGATQAKGHTNHDPAPLLVSASSGRFPVIDLEDEYYAPLAHEYLPELLDWYEALCAGMDTTPEELLARGLTNNKVARLMRVFVSIRVHRDKSMEEAMAPAIGWCRVHFRRDWAAYKAGEVWTLLVVVTDQGWFVIDPVSRQMRKLATNDPTWWIGFIVM